jgi:glycosyltransferase involved in cell wall biosynthesis
MTPKISIVTVTLNSERTLRACLDSVKAQLYENVEHVLVDGLSTDGTTAIIAEYAEHLAVRVSARDSGVYDALNRGFRLASGDIIGILHSDDIFYDEFVLDRVAAAFGDAATEYIYGDIQMIDSDGKLKRYWKAGPLPNGKIESTQLPHPGIFLSKKLVSRIDPPFDPSYQISADLKQQLIFANMLRANGVYVNFPLVKMRIGGKSTSSLGAYIDGWRESARAWNEVHGNGGSLYVLKKVISKLWGIQGIGY